MAYQLEGKLLEVCTCNVLCPCWVGEDPDGGTCTGVLSWHVEKGTINGIDVSGHTLAILTFIPGNILEGNWRVIGMVNGCLGRFEIDPGAIRQVQAVAVAQAEPLATGRAPDLREQRAEVAGGGGGRRVGPQDLDQLLAADGPVPVQDEVREQQPAFT